MNSMIRSRLLAAGLVGLLLVACDSIKDVREAPSTPLPAQTGVIAGKIVGLGTARPVVLSFDGQKDCRAPDPANLALLVPSDCKFYGTTSVDKVSSFAFTSFDENNVPQGTPVGVAYNVTVEKQPFGKICSVTNGSGEVGGAELPITVNCIDDPALTRYSVTVNTGPLSILDDATVTLTTEDGVQTKDAAGQASVVFDDAIFNSGTSLPLFQYQLTASYTTTQAGVETTNYCAFTAVTSGANTINLGGTNVDGSFNVITPSGDATVAVNACLFPVNVTVAYSGTPAVTGIPPGSMKLGLKNHFPGVVEQTLPVDWAFSTATVRAFPNQVPANAGSIYEVVVTEQPDNQQCIVSGTISAFSTMIASAGGSVIAPTGSAVMFVDPRVPEWWTSTAATTTGARAVRCRTRPTNVLTGTYQTDRPLPTASQLAASPPTIPPQAREFLTFFDDGTFLYGINFTGVTTCGVEAIPPNFPSCQAASTSAARLIGENGPTATAANPGSGANANAASGVVHGFYAYDPVAKTIAFTVFTASNIFPSYMGLNGMPGYANGTASVTATNVTKSGSPGAGHISLTFTGTRPVPYPGGAVGTYSGAAQTVTWEMTEPYSVPGELSGVWVTPDHLRMFTFDTRYTFGFHMGVSGLPTVQDACFVVNDDGVSTQSGGFFTRHSGFTFNCFIGGNSGALTRDVPHYATTGAVRTMPRIPPNYSGRLPGSAAQLDGRPTSPNAFSIALASGSIPDELTVQATSNGTLVGLPVTFVREGAN
jgi:hypothetical protein